MPVTGQPATDRVRIFDMVELEVEGVCLCRWNESPHVTRKPVAKTTVGAFVNTIHTTEPFPGSSYHPIAVFDGKGAVQGYRRNTSFDPKPFSRIP